MVAGSGCELLQNFSSQLLGFSEKFLVLREQAIQFNGLFWLEAMSQKHVANVNRVGEQRFFLNFFEGGSGIVVIHVDSLVFCGFIFPKPSE